MDNGSSDGTAAQISQFYPDVVLIEAGRNLGAAGRTVGVQHTDAPYVAFADDDSGWESGALSTAASLFDRHPTLGLVQAAMLVGDDARLDPICLRMATELPNIDSRPGVPIIGFVACGAVVRREAYLDVGGFHPRFGVGGEEALLAMDLLAAGWLVRYVDELTALHWPSTNRIVSERLARERRNDLWTYWLRRRPASAGSRTLQHITAAARGDAATARGVLRATLGLPWVIRHRRRLPEDVEQLLDEYGSRKVTASGE